MAPRGLNLRRRAQLCRRRSPRSGRSLSRGVRKEKATMSVEAPVAIVGAEIEERMHSQFRALNRAILSDPSILEEIPNESALSLIPDDADEESLEANIALGLDALRKGRSVFFKRLAPGEWGIPSSTHSGEPAE